MLQEIEGQEEIGVTGQPGVAWKITGVEEKKEEKMSI